MRKFLALILLLLALPTPASAASILFVSDNLSDTNIPTVLIGAGHTVTTVTNDYMAGANPTLNGSLAGYDAVFWSATGDGFGANTSAATRTALENYVSAGGFLFVTGYDSIASPVDPQLTMLLGGTGAVDVPGAPGAVAMIANELTTGVVDIRGVTPTGAAGDRDALTGFGAGVTVVVSTMGVATQAQWLIRSIGRGRVAYVSNGDPGTSAHASWTNTAAGGAGAYNAALRNFAFWSAGATTLFVSDSATDTNIPGVLTADGHFVTTVTNDFMAGANPTLNGSLAQYEAVVWSATGDGFGANTAAGTITNLTNYVNAGGRLFVTGYDSIASPTDANLIGLLGGTGSVDVPGAVGAVTGASNALTTGRVDIRGVTPTGGAGDRDALTGSGAGVTVVASTTGVPTQAQWTLRTLGSGLVAYVSNGDPTPSAHASWTTTTAGGAGAYNAAVRNFLFNASQRSTPLRPNGAACSAGAECVSTFCADGVCCGSACTGGAVDCQACSIAAGGTTNGTCTPLTAMAAAAITCRASAGVCDAAETCSPAATTCPADAFAAAGTGCRPSGGVCDVAETCTGASAACPGDTFAGAGTPCRMAADVCDLAEACTGAGAACPADGFVAAGTPCRGAAGACDLAEACSGAGAACPGDAFLVAGSECRAATGTCDIAESCTGGTPDCPVDTLVAAGTECRGVGGVCDTAETCDGATGACPADTVVAAGTECRASISACDVAESCDGAALSCPADGFAADGTACGDGTTCNGDESCAAGACAPGTTLDCDDGNVCTADSCAEPGGCANEPITGCCDDDADCDDGDTCTDDVCDLGTNTCSNDPLPACLDAGTPDAGTEDDGGMTGDDAGMGGDDSGMGGSDSGMGSGDAGRRPSPRDEGGCCHVPATRQGPHPGLMLVIAALFGAVIFRRRRR